jgi:hypothetical protein
MLRLRLKAERPPSRRRTLLKLVFGQNRQDQSSYTQKSDRPEYHYGSGECHSPVPSSQGATAACYGYSPNDSCCQRDKSECGRRAIFIPSRYRYYDDNNHGSQHVKRTANDLQDPGGCA